MDYSVERVKIGDEEILAYIQTESWKAAFKDILDEETLKQYTQLDKAREMYKTLLQQNSRNGYLLKVEGEPHCMAWWGASRDEDMPDYAELICIHSLQNKWRKGYGRKMMDRVLQDMKADGWEKAMLWVFEENLRARAFYEALGFAANGKKKEFLGSTELCYEKISL